MKKNKKFKFGFVEGLFMSIFIILSVTLGIYMIYKPNYIITKQECHNESITTDWYSIRSHQSFQLANLYIKSDMIVGFEVKPDYFNGWDYFYILCENLLNDSGVKRPFDVLNVGTCDNYRYENKYYYNLDTEDFVGCLTCSYEKLNKNEKDNIISYSTDVSIDKQFYNVKFKVPSFKFNKVYINNYTPEFERVENDNGYWDAEIRFKLKEKQVCEDKETEDIFFENNAYTDFGKVFNGVKVDIVNGGYTLDKKDLTKEWLDENCIPNSCLNAEQLDKCLNDYRETVKHSTKLKSNYYKCFENYEVTIQ